jgi:hypothetical protein
MVVGGFFAAGASCYLGAFLIAGAWRSPRALLEVWVLFGGLPLILVAVALRAARRVREGGGGELQLLTRVSPVLLAIGAVIGLVLAVAGWRATARDHDELAAESCRALTGASVAGAEQCMSVASACVYEVIGYRADVERPPPSKGLMLACIRARLADRGTPFAQIVARDSSR